MKDVRSSKTTNLRIECVNYYLSDTGDVFRVINEISKVLGGAKMRNLSGYVFRYAKFTDMELLIVAALPKEECFTRKIKHSLYADELEDFTRNQVKDLGVDITELEDGMYAVDVSEYLQDITKLSEICSTLLSTDKDIWLNMGEGLTERIAWKPDYINNHYVLVQSIIPSSGEVDDIVEVKGNMLKLC